MLSERLQKERWLKYIYKNGVLKNRLGIKDKDKLEEIESIIVSQKMIELNEYKIPNKPSYEDYKEIHKILFGDIFDWAGTDRDVNIYKSEKILYGLGINYTEVEHIEKTGKSILYEMNTVKWHILDLESKSDLLTKYITKLWKNHSFREGNTRTTLAFMSLYCSANNIPYQKSVIEKYTTVIRDTLVLASLDEPEPQLFKKIIHEALAKGMQRENISPHKTPNKKHDDREK